VVDAELALSEKQKKGQIFTGNMPYLTYYFKLQCWDLPLEVSPDNLTDHNHSEQKIVQKTAQEKHIVQKQI
jgi:hypothetical protein